MPQRAERGDKFWGSLSCFFPVHDDKGKGNLPHMPVHLLWDKPGSPPSQAPHAGITVTMFGA